MGRTANASEEPGGESGPLGENPCFGKVEAEVRRENLQVALKAAAPHRGVRDPRGRDSANRVPYLK